MARSSLARSSIAPLPWETRLTGDALGLRRLQHVLEHARSLDAGDLDPERGPVGERPAAGPVAAVGSADPEFAEYAGDPLHRDRFLRSVMQNEIFFIRMTR